MVARARERERERERPLRAPCEPVQAAAAAGQKNIMSFFNKK
jgi:hypothetical protein